MHMDTPQRPTDFAIADCTPRQLRDAFGKFATGITLITCNSEAGPICIVANSFSSVSLDPALVLWCLDHNSNRYRYFQTADHYAIHVLSAEQGALCGMAAKDAHGLRDAGLAVNGHGVPLIEDSLARFECQRTAVHIAGDHDIIVGQVHHAQLRDGVPLTFYEGQVGALG